MSAYLNTPQKKIRWTVLEKSAFIAILILATGLRLFHLGSQPIWCDESYFWQCANHPGWFATLLHTVADDVYPPLFFLLLHGLGLFTTSEFLIRLPMALAGVAAVGVLVVLLRRFADKRAALFAGALAAVSPVLIYYSQELKMYSILALFLLLLFYETVLCLEDPGRGWKRLALWATLAVYTFYLSLLVWFCLLGMVWWKTRRNWRQASSIWKGFAVAGLFFLPWAPFFIKSVVVNRGSVYNFFMDRILLYSYQNFSVGFWAADWLAWTGLTIFGVFVSVGLIQSKGWFPRLLAALSFLPLLLSWVISLASKPMYSDRAMLVCALGWLALTGMGLASVKNTKAAWLGFLLLMGLSLFSLQRYAFDPLSRRVDYKPAWTYVTQNWKVGDSIFHQDLYTYYPFKFYALQEARGNALRPNWIYSEPPVFLSDKTAGRFRQIWRGVNAWLKARGMGIYTGYNLDMVAGERLEREALPGVKRIWYLNTDKTAAARIWMPQINVYRHGFNNWTPFEPEKIDWLKKNFQLVNHIQVDNSVDIYVFEKRGLKGGKIK